jgi:hypothetical protein
MESITDIRQLIHFQEVLAAEQRNIEHDLATLSGDLPSAVIHELNQAQLELVAQHAPLARKLAQQAQALGRKSSAASVSDGDFSAFVSPASMQSFASTATANSVDCATPPIFGLESPGGAWSPSSLVCVCGAD